MRRRLFTLFSALSLLICVATVALWIGSYTSADVAGWYPGDGIEWRISSARGQFQVLQTYWIGDDPPGTADDNSPPPSFHRRERFPSLDYPPGAFVWWRYIWETGDDAGREISLAGITWRSRSAAPDAPHFYAPLFVTVPHWLVVGLRLSHLVA